MFCLSKGLCAPVGSLLAGTKDFVAAARLKRKVMGGGMRQAGILAAAGLVALKEHPSLLADDHRRAKKLAQGLGNINGVSVDAGAVDINMVFFSYSRTESPQSAEWADAIVRRFAERGIAINPPEQGMFRFVTHYWIGDREIEAILAASEELFAHAPDGKGQIP
jgi:threonine aldolase